MAETASSPVPLKAKWIVFLEVLKSPVTMAIVTGLLGIAGTLFTQAVVLRPLPSQKPPAIQQLVSVPKPVPVQAVCPGMADVATSLVAVHAKLDDLKEALPKKKARKPKAQPAVTLFAAPKGK